MTADTSSAAAGMIVAVGAATAVACRTASPIAPKSAAAALRACGAAIRKDDIRELQSTRRGQTAQS